MRILWMSDSPTTPSGYGNVTRFVCAGLADRGHHVSILGWQAQGQPTPWHNCMLYPGAFSANALLNELNRLQPDVLVILADICRLTFFNDSFINFMQTASFPWVLYCPIDADMGENRLPSTWVRILKTVDLPIAMSHYGRDVMQANGVVPTHIPFGVDTKVFQPPADKGPAKQALGYEGKFVVLSDAHSQFHKMLPRTLEIFQRFAVGKDDVILHLHCDPDEPRGRSPKYVYDLRSDIAFLNLTDKVCFTKDMSISAELPLEQLAAVYQTADVHLLTSWGEGMGLPTLQAAAAGVVPMAPDYAASRELVLNQGDTISIRHFLLDQFGLRRALVDVDDAVSKLEKLYRDRQLLACKAQRARELALSYDWESIVSQWEELLQHEVSRRKTSLHSSVNTSDLSRDPREEEGLSNLTHGVHKDDELVADLLQAARFEHTLRIPVTLPLVGSKQRVTGCVYVASQSDVPIVLVLHRIFPGLNVWSTIPLDFASSGSNGEPIQAKVVQANSPQYRPHLAVSTLALDTASFDPRLPVEAAKLGVPCVGLAQRREQAWLWPELSLEKADPLMAAKLGRRMLTDQGVAADLSLGARQRLAGTLTAVNDGRRK